MVYDAQHSFSGVIYGQHSFKTGGTERLRITPGPLHTDEMIYDLTISLKHAFNKTNNIVYKKYA